MVTNLFLNPIPLVLNHQDVSLLMRIERNQFDKLQTELYRQPLLLVLLPLIEMLLEHEVEILHHCNLQDF